MIGLKVLFVSFLPHSSTRVLLASSYSARYVTRNSKTKTTAHAFMQEERRKKEGKFRQNKVEMEKDICSNQSGGKSKHKGRASEVVEVRKNDRLCSVETFESPVTRTNATRMTRAKTRKKRQSLYHPHRPTNIYFRVWDVTWRETRGNIILERAFDLWILCL